MSVQLTLTFATATAAAAALSLLSGNVAAPTPSPTPATTRYFHDAAHRSVYAIQPGHVIPSVPGAVEIDSATFATLQSQYSAPPAPTSAPSSAPAAAPAPAAAGVDDMFGGPSVTPMTADQFTNALKAACDPAKNPGARAKLTAFLGKKGVASVGQLVAGKTDTELGALFVEASAAVA